MKRSWRQERSKLQRLNNRKSYYEKGERQKRTHRLVTKGAAIESIVPISKNLTETEFYAFAEKVLAVPEVRGPAHGGGQRPQHGRAETG